MDVRLYSENNEELELKENIEDGIEYDPEKDKKYLSEEEVVAEDDLSNGYSEDVDDDVLLDEEDVEDSDKLFDDLGDEDDEAIFDNDLANDNLDNDDDIIE